MTHYSSFPILISPDFCHYPLPPTPLSPRRDLKTYPLTASPPPPQTPSPPAPPPPTLPKGPPTNRNHPTYPLNSPLPPGAPPPQQSRDTKLSTLPFSAISGPTSSEAEWRYPHQRDLSACGLFGQLSVRNGLCVWCCSIEQRDLE